VKSENKKMKIKARIFLIYRISIVLLTFLSASLPGCSQNELTGTGTLILDETKNSESVGQVIAIDKIWAGHPVEIALVTAGNRQYVSYYNSDRHMMVGQRNLSDPAFNLYAMPVTSRESAGGTTTVQGWDSHNYITLAVDREGFIHLAGCLLPSLINRLSQIPSR
jgi:hypothetical protein